MWIFESNLSAEKFLSADNEYSRNYIAQLNSEYEEYKDTPLMELSFFSFMKFMRDGDRLAYEKEYFQRRKMLRDFALKAWICSDETALIHLENVMWAVCNEFTWVLPAHLGNDIFNETIDLFAAETAQTLTEIISLLQEKLSDTVVERCIREVKRRVLDPFIKRSKPYNWESMKSNWCAVCGGCLGMTALYLIEDENDIRGITNSLKPTFDSYISSFADDGACLEGLYYWNYGMMYFTAFLDLYKQRMDEDFSVDTDKVRKMADFAHKCCISDGFTISFSDGYERDRIYSGLADKLHEMYDSSLISNEYLAGFDGDDCGRWCKAVRDIAWTAGTKKIANNCGKVSLPMAQWAVLHGDNISVAFKGGSNGEPHNHNDVGGIIAVKEGEVILCDIGAGKYTADYFSDGRYNIFCNRSMGHSVPLINGCEQKTGGEYKARGFFAAGNETGADISGAYGIDVLKECARTVRCLEDKVEVEDKFTLDTETKITERFITCYSAVIENNEVKIIADGKQLGRLVTDNAHEIEIKTYTHHEHDGSISDITSIDFKFTANGEYNFLVEML